MGFSSENKRMAVPQTCLNVEEKKLYDMITAYRKSKKLPPIPLSDKLTHVAQAHARDLMEHYTFDPEKNQCNPHSWSDKGKWSSCCYTSDHKQAACMWKKPEEIAGYEGLGYEIAYYSSDDVSAQEGLDGWKKSPGHNPLIINSGMWQKVKWNAIGIAMYKSYGLVWFGEVEDPVQPKICP
jgi:uncharacterized protein YkwD